MVYQGSPPLARGVPEFKLWADAKHGITPACAGSTHCKPRLSVILWDHPRLRGEYALRLVTVPLNQGSPPLARGVRVAFGNCAIKSRITPACAGSTDLEDDRIRHQKDHPRLRGEYSQLQLESMMEEGSPPLARGVHNTNKITLINNRITPACAGSTIFLETVGIITQDHPRLRGEYCDYLASYKDELGSPPLARGVQSLGITSAVGCGITPACAGSTLKKA